MLPKRVYKFSGISFLAIGFVFLLNSIVSITGNAIIEDVSAGEGSFWSFWFIATGIILFVEGSKGELINRSNGGIELSITRPFEKDIRRHDLGEINDALSKIGTGLAREEALKGKLKGYKSVRVTQGGRIVFGYNDQNHVKIIGYTPNHDYEEIERRV